MVLAMPLVAQALPLKLVSPQTGQALMRDLKAGGHWLEAHALWMYLVGGPVPLIFNGDFEQGFIGDGFDWELRDTQRLNGWRAGGAAPAGRAGPGAAGGVHRPPGGAARGAAVAGAAGRRLHVLGQVHGKPHCAPNRAWSGPSPVWPAAANWRARRRWSTPGASGAHLRGPQVPPDCGGAVALQLQTQLGSEALAGMRGQMTFDAFRLVPR